MEGWRAVEGDEERRGYKRRLRRVALATLAVESDSEASKGRLAVLWQCGSHSHCQ